MRILINLSNNFKIYIENEINSFDLVLSPYRDLEFANNQTVKEVVFFSSIFGQATLMNQYFWIINIRRDMQRPNKKIKEIIIYHGEKLNLSKYKDIKSIEIKGKYIVVKNLDYIRIPTNSFYDKNVLHHVDKYIESWLWLLQNIQKNMEQSISYSESDIFSKDPKIKKIYNHVIKNKNFINAGNEGILVWKENYTKIEKTTNIEPKYPKDIQSLYEKYQVINCQKNDIPKFYEDSQLKIVAKEKGDKRIFEYPNIISPVSNLNFVSLARLLIRQWETSIFIDDNKVINYGKIRFKDTPFFEIIYNDLGNSFVKTENTSFKEGIIRDVYFLVKNQQKINHRNIIFSKRTKTTRELFADEKFERFYNFVMEKYRLMPMACHDKTVLENLSIYDVIYTCGKSNTMNRKIKYVSDKKWVYEMKSNKVYECGDNFDDINFIKHEDVRELSENLEFINGAIRWIRK